MSFNGVFTASTNTAAPSYGLFSVAEVREHGYENSSWISGAVFESTECIGNLTANSICDPDDIDILDKSENGLVLARGVAAFNIVYTVSCENSIGFRSKDFKKVVTDGVKDRSEYALEFELASGEAANAFNNATSTASLPDALALDAGIDVTSGSAVDVNSAIALLEAAYYANNPTVQGTIHLPVAMLSKVRFGLAKDHNGVLVTKAGSKITLNKAMGTDQTPLAGEVFMTGPVYVELGSEELITVTEDVIVNSKNNQVNFTATRPAAVYFDGCDVYSALADATL